MAQTIGIIDIKDIVGIDIKTKSFSKPNVYIIFEIDSNKQKTVEKYGKNPKWNDNFYFNVGENSVLRASVYNSKSNEFIGGFNYMLNDTFYVEQKTIKMKLFNEKQQEKGELQFVVQFHRNPIQDTYYTEPSIENSFRMENDIDEEEDDDDDVPLPRKDSVIDSHYNSLRKNNTFNSSSPNIKPLYKNNNSKVNAYSSGYSPKYQNNPNRRSRSLSPMPFDKDISLNRNHSVPSPYGKQIPQNRNSPRERLYHFKSSESLNSKQNSRSPAFEMDNSNLNPKYSNDISQSQPTYNNGNNNYSPSDTEDSEIYSSSLPPNNKIYSSPGKFSKYPYNSKIPASINKYGRSSPSSVKSSHLMVDTTSHYSPKQNFNQSPLIKSDGSLYNNNSNSATSISTMNSNYSKSPSLRVKTISNYNNNNGNVNSPSTPRSLTPRTPNSAASISKNSNIPKSSNIPLSSNIPKSSNIPIPLNSPKLGSSLPKPQSIAKSPSLPKTSNIPIPANGSFIPKPAKAARRKTALKSRSGTDSSSRNGSNSGSIKRNDYSTASNEGSSPEMRNGLSLPSTEININHRMMNEPVSEENMSRTNGSSDGRLRSKRISLVRAAKDNNDYNKPIPSPSHLYGPRNANNINVNNTIDNFNLDNSNNFKSENKNNIINNNNNNNIKTNNRNSINVNVNSNNNINPVNAIPSSTDNDINSVNPVAPMKNRNRRSRYKIRSISNDSALYNRNRFSLCSANTFTSLDKSFEMRHIDNNPDQSINDSYSTEVLVIDSSMDSSYQRSSRGANNSFIVDKVLTPTYRYRTSMRRSASLDSIINQRKQQLDELINSSKNWNNKTIDNDNDEGEEEEEEERGRSRNPQPTPQQTIFLPRGSSLKKPFNQRRLSKQPIQPPTIEESPIQESIQEEPIPKPIQEPVQEPVQKPIEEDQESEEDSEDPPRFYSLIDSNKRRESHIFGNQEEMTKLENINVDSYDNDDNINHGNNMNEIENENGNGNRNGNGNINKFNDIDDENNAKDNNNYSLYLRRPPSDNRLSRNISFSGKANLNNLLNSYPLKNNSNNNNNSGINNSLSPSSSFQSIDVNREIGSPILRGGLRNYSQKLNDIYSKTNKSPVNKKTVETENSFVVEQQSQPESNSLIKKYSPRRTSLSLKIHQQQILCNKELNSVKVVSPSDTPVPSSAKILMSDTLGRERPLTSDEIKNEIPSPKSSPYSGSGTLEDPKNIKLLQEKLNRISISLKMKKAGRNGSNSKSLEDSSSDTFKSPSSSILPSPKINFITTNSDSPIVSSVSAATPLANLSPNLNAINSDSNGTTSNNDGMKNIASNDNIEDIKKYQENLINGTLEDSEPSVLNSSMEENGETLDESSQSFSDSKKDKDKKQWKDKYLRYIKKNSIQGKSKLDQCISEPTSDNSDVDSEDNDHEREIKFKTPHLEILNQPEEVSYTRILPSPEVASTSFEEVKIIEESTLDYENSINNINNNSNDSPLNGANIETLDAKENEEEEPAPYAPNQKAYPQFVDHHHYSNDSFDPISTHNHDEDIVNDMHGLETGNENQNEAEKDNESLIGGNTSRIIPTEDRELPDNTSRIISKEERELTDNTSRLYNADKELAANTSRILEELSYELLSPRQEEHLNSSYINMNSQDILARTNLSSISFNEGPSSSFLSPELRNRNSVERKKIIDTNFNILSQQIQKIRDECDSSFMNESSTENITAHDDRHLSPNPNLSIDTSISAISNQNLTPKIEEDKSDNESSFNPPRFDSNVDMNEAIEDYHQSQNFEISPTTPVTPIIVINPKRERSFSKDKPSYYENREAIVESAVVPTTPIEEGNSINDIMPERKDSLMTPEANDTNLDTLSNTSDYSDSGDEGDVTVYPINNMEEEEEEIDDFGTITRNTKITNLVTNNNNDHDDHNNNGHDMVVNVNNGNGNNKSTNGPVEEDEEDEITTPKLHQAPILLSTSLYGPSIQIPTGPSLQSDIYNISFDESDTTDQEDQPPRTLSLRYSSKEISRDQNQDQNQDQGQGPMTNIRKNRLRSNSLSSIISSSTHSNWGDEDAIERSLGKRISNINNNSNEVATRRLTFGLDTSEQLVSKLKRSNSLSSISTTSSYTYSLINKDTELNRQRNIPAVSKLSPLNNSFVPRRIPPVRPMINMNGSSNDSRSTTPTGDGQYSEGRVYQAGNITNTTPMVTTSFYDKAPHPPMIKTQTPNPMMNAKFLSPFRGKNTISVMMNNNGNNNTMMKPSTPVSPISPVSPVSTVSPVSPISPRSPSRENKLASYGNGNNGNNGNNSNTLAMNRLSTTGSSISIASSNNTSPLVKPQKSHKRFGHFKKSSNNSLHHNNISMTNLPVSNIPTSSTPGSNNLPMNMYHPSNYNNNYSGDESFTMDDQSHNSFPMRKVGSQEENIISVKPTKTFSSRIPFLNHKRINPSGTFENNNQSNINVLSNAKLEMHPVNNQL